LQILEHRELIQQLRKQSKQQWNLLRGHQPSNHDIALGVHISACRSVNSLGNDWRLQHLLDTGDNLGLCKRASEMNPWNLRLLWRLRLLFGFFRSSGRCGSCWRCGGNGGILGSHNQPQHLAAGSKISKNIAKFLIRTDRDEIVFLIAVLDITISGGDASQRHNRRFQLGERRVIASDGQTSQRVLKLDFQLD
jgi:hypothetical protein